MNSARALPRVKALLALAFVFFVLLACSRQAGAQSISDCSNLTTDNTSYLLSGDVSSNGTCFNVTAFNVTIDCQGHSVNYSLDPVIGGCGVSVDGDYSANNATVKNCVFKQTNLNVSAPGICLSGVSNSLVRNNSFTTSGSSSYAVTLSGSGNVIDGNLVNTPNATGFHASSASSNNFSNNVIITSNQSCRGISFQASSNNFIVNNTITTAGNQSTGIWFEISSANLVANNTINVSGSTSMGFHGNQGSSHNVLDGNNITTSGTVGYGIHFFANCVNNTLRNNVISTSGDNGYGIEFALNSNNITAVNNTVSTTGTDFFGLFIDTCSNVNFSRFTVTTSGPNGLGFEIVGPVNAVFTDGVLSTGASTSVYFSPTSAGAINFTNVTFVKSQVNFQSGSTSQLNVSWYVDTLVTNGTGDAVDSASVNITDANTTNIFYGSTDATGFLPRITVGEYLQNLTGIYNFTPHTFAASKSGYEPASNTTPISQNTLVNVVLGIAANLSDCGIISTPNSYYALNKSLYSPGATCITIEAVNVTVDCNYYGTIYSITSNRTADTYGVFSVFKYANSTIKNCIISNFSSSIKLSGSNAIIYGNTLNYSSTAGIFSGGANARIYSNAIYGSYYGVWLDCDRAVVYNNTIYSVGDSAVQGPSHDSLNISYNLIRDAGAVCLYLTVTGSSIHDNTCFNPLFEGIWLNPGSENNLFYNNRIWNCTNGIAGNFINTSIFNNTLLNITRDTGVTGIASAIHIQTGIGTHDGNNNIFDNTIFNNTAGIQLNGSDNNYIHSNNISYNTHVNVIFTCREGMGGCDDESDSIGNSLISNTLLGGNYGLIIKSNGSNIATNHSINKNFISGAGIASIYFIGASNNTVIDSTLSADYAGGANNTVSNLAASNTFVNVTFNKSAVAYEDADSNLTVEWYLGVRVVDQSNNPISNATVNATNVNGNLLFTLTTDSNGYVVTQNVSEYAQNSTNTLNFTPHLVSARKNPSNSTQTILSQNNNVVLVLQMPTSLTISNVHIIDVTQNTVTIGWDTDRAANETLDYGLTTAYGPTYSNAALATTHSAYINSLTAGTTYHYRVAGCDVYNNCAQTGDYTFDTPGDTGGGGGGGGGTPTPVATVLPSPEASPGPTVAPTSLPPSTSPSPKASPAVERDTVCVAGAVSELEIKRIVTVFSADGALHTLVELIVTNKGSRVLENVRVSDQIPLALVPTAKFFNAPSSFSGGNATWLAGTLAPGESKKFAYLLPGRVSAGEFQKPVAYGNQLYATGGSQLFALLIALVILAALVVFILKRRKSYRRL